MVCSQELGGSQGILSQPRGTATFSNQSTSETPKNHSIVFSLHKVAMSFGGPGGLAKAQKPTPPERGSFPLEFVPPFHSAPSNFYLG